MRNNTISLRSFIVLVFMFSVSVSSQSAFQHQRDSLRQIIPTLTGKEKLDTYNKLQIIYMDNLSDESSLSSFLLLSQEYEKEAAAQKDIKRQGDVKVNYLIACLKMNNHEKVDENVHETLKFLSDNNFTDALYMTYKQLILSYCRRGLYKKAFDEMKDVYEQAQIQNNNESRFYMQYLMGITYMHQNRLAEAEQHYRESIEIASKMTKSPFGLIAAYSELCNMLQATGRLDDFFDLAAQTEKLMEKLSKENKSKSYNTEKKNLWILYAYAYEAREDYDKTEFYCNKIDSLYGGNIVSLGNTTFLRSHVWDARGDYNKALMYINKAIEIDPTNTYARFAKVKILSHIENAPLTWTEMEKTMAYVDSLRNISDNKQIDELRTQYEVDIHIAETEKTRNYLYFAFAGCLLLVVALGIWIYYNRKVANKNKVLVRQIKELQNKHDSEEKELIYQINNHHTETGSENDFCPERRKDQLCVAIRNALLNEKVYRDSTITRDGMVELLGTNKDMFIDAFQHCFGMSFLDYLNYLRMKDAITLLEGSDLTIGEISEKVGFGTVRTFQRQFQAKYNMSPKDYRKVSIS